VLSLAWKSVSLNCGRQAGAKIPTGWKRWIFFISSTLFGDSGLKVAESGNRRVVNMSNYFSRSGIRFHSLAVVSDDLQKAEIHQWLIRKILKLPQGESVDDFRTPLLQSTAGMNVVTDRILQQIAVIGAYVAMAACSKFDHRCFLHAPIVHNSLSGVKYIIPLSFISTLFQWRAAQWGRKSCFVNFAGFVNRSPVQHALSPNCPVFSDKHN